MGARLHARTVSHRQSNFLYIAGKLFPWKQRAIVLRRVGGHLVDPLVRGESHHVGQGRHEIGMNRSFVLVDGTNPNRRLDTLVHLAHIHTALIPVNDDFEHVRLLQLGICNSIVI
ncbi:hypothetical protein AGDE_12976 [Angomonas deanei]|uniref:Uncharacterized protein n=1 Tax=Angomonas deanei TaxID=59799 RepID=A0A7G2CEE8_9TRYP|nr:hypothetical protein AGDE_12976 [Angomonas deanei]CAD2216542.1 hypothetical protein, conserved [Angomonas deanei]|eukprot:EPY23143.1 hypothetical protein AGDE_12976 [Angomonas deanei]